MKSEELRAFSYSFFSIISGFRKNKLLHLTSVFTVMICFFIMGSGMNVFFNIKSQLNLSKLRTHVSAYLEQDVSPEEFQLFKQKHCAREFIDECSYMTTAQAKEKFSKKNPDLKNILESLDENPFPPSIEIDFKRDFKNINQLQEFSSNLSQDKNIIHVDDGGKWVTRWLQILGFFDKLTFILGVGFSFLVAFVVSNTIQLLVYSRKDEVEILGLVGATRNMIRFPFLVEGLIHGLVGSILGIVLVKLTFVWISSYLHQAWPGLIPEQLIFIPLYAQSFLILLASLIGLLGSFLAVGRFLK